MFVHKNFNNKKTVTDCTIQICTYVAKYECQAAIYVCTNVYRYIYVYQPINLH